MRLVVVGAGVCTHRVPEPMLSHDVVVRSVRAAIYARVSTDDQAAEGTSLDAQVDRCAVHARSQGWDVVGPFIDRGVSGAVSSRPALDQVVRLVEDGELEVVVITKLDRIARSLRHLLDLLELLERRRVSLVALDDPLDPSTASGRAMVQLRGVFAELERQLIRERTSEGQRRRVESGGWPGGPPPYGYKTVTSPTSQGKALVVDQDEAAIVRLCYQMLVEDGMTTGEVAAALNRLGTRPRSAREWTHWNLRRLLLDGRGLSGRWPWRRAGRQKRSDDDEVIVTIPAVLTPDEHERLLAVLAATSTQPISRRPYLLRGLIESPHGTRMQGIPGHGSQRWYQCPQRHTQRYSDTARCECRRLHAATVEEAVWEQVTSLWATPLHLRRWRGKPNRREVSTPRRNVSSSTRWTLASPRWRTRSPTSTRAYERKGSIPPRRAPRSERATSCSSTFVVSGTTFGA
jgi:DNA invertase Pin-like site-specific DNA recombinase